MLPDGESVQEGVVSIPLKSGHWFNDDHAERWGCRMRLNPFEIRALVQSVVREHQFAKGLSQSL